jgi:putative hydrolase of the HAD superfamily
VSLAGSAAALGTARVDAVLFDYGNTLASFQRPEAALLDAYERIAALLRQRGLASPAGEVLLREVHERVEDEFLVHQRSGRLDEIDLVPVAQRAYARLGLDVDAALLDETLVIEQEAWWQGVRIDPEALPVLAELRGAGLRVGLCSNAPYRVRSMHAQLDHFGLRTTFDAVAFSGQVGWRKPSPRIFEHALQGLGTSPAHTVMVGDTERDDIAGAHGAGMRAILARNHADGAPAAGTAAEAVIHHLVELVPLLRGFAGIYS